MKVTLTLTLTLTDHFGVGGRGGEGTWLRGVTRAVGMNGIPAGVAGFSDVDDADDVAKPRSTDVFTGDVGGGVWSEGAGRGGAKSPAKVGEHEQFELLSPASSTIPPEVYTWPLDVQVCDHLTSLLTPSPPASPRDASTVLFSPSSFFSFF
jgi:hypothetical protein